MLQSSGLNHNLEIPEPPTAPSPNEPAPVAVHKLDFAALGFPEYEDKYALVIDNLFTPADCQKLLDAAESAKEWEVAQVNGIGGFGYTDISYRNSQRILYDDFDLADWILEKLRPYVGEIESVDPERHHMMTRSMQERKAMGYRVPAPVQLSRVNERLRYLKYGPGQYFRRHCDGGYYTPDETEVSYYTLQLYLNGDAESLQGGATRFFSSWKGRNNPEKHLDVNPRAGRVLIFEQDGLLHAGEDVVHGTKITIRSEFMYRFTTLDVPDDQEQPLTPLAAEESRASEAE
ncbi:hypothetical protein FRB94_006612 [Tulasnella sp. JGI-2019a]|nr:hypothetical protein FRB94_006612 [Tulasnella sp. JGI-2019a]KAG9000121.1 hypothetical protein FRB93_012885 [Tulasnella sp. JGI-2019a]KAG9036796.1 hypothetical protein FRB95_007894 [Tulasnella sp. JGI-2019a]